MERFPSMYRFNTMGMLFDGEGPPSDMLIEPLIVSEHRVRGGGKDIWGVEYVPTESTGNALIPKTSDFILEDITKWRDVIKAPDLSGIDWRRCAKMTSKAGILTDRKRPSA